MRSAPGSQSASVSLTDSTSGADMADPEQWTTIALSSLCPNRYSQGVIT